MTDKHEPISPSANAMPKVVSFQDPLPEPQRYRPPADRILAGDPAQAAINLFQSSDGRFNTGIWEAQPGKWRVVFTESEFSPAGFTGTWEILEPAKKLYAYYE
jgi:uncharacterized cupin superfamily protein